MKTLLVWGNAPIRVHWSVAPALVLLWIFQGSRALLWGAVALLLHEMGHLLCARGLGFGVKAVELWPFGAAMDTDVQGPGEGLVALAGPVCSLTAAGAGRILGWLLPGVGEVMEAFVLVNLGLGLFNLLPAWPLDGGRALMGLLSRRLSRSRARSLVCYGSLTLGAGLLAVLVYGAVLGVGTEGAFVLVGFLLFSGIRGLRLEDRAVEDLLIQEQTLRSGRPLEVRMAAVTAAVPAKEALLSLRRGRYTCLQILSPAGEPMGVLTQSALLNAIAHGGGSVTVGELVK